LKLCLAKNKDIARWAQKRNYKEKALTLTLSKYLGSILQDTPPNSISEVQISNTCWGACPQPQTSVLHMLITPAPFIFWHLCMQNLPAHFKPALGPSIHISTHPFVKPLQVGHLLGLLQLLLVILRVHFQLLTCCHCREFAQPRDIDYGNLGGRERNGMEELIACVPY